VIHGRSDNQREKIRINLSVLAHLLLTSQVTATDRANSTSIASCRVAAGSGKKSRSVTISMKICKQKTKVSDASNQYSDPHMNIASVRYEMCSSSHSVDNFSADALNGVELQWR
jgi:hypothetical protein